MAAPNPLTDKENSLHETKEEINKIFDDIKSLVDSAHEHITNIPAGGSSVPDTTKPLTQNAPVSTVQDNALDELTNLNDDESEHVKNKVYSCVFDENESKTINSYKSKVKSICQELALDHTTMKVVFIGGQRVGKSTTINAMLGEKVCGSGNSYVLQVEGSQTGDAYLVTKGSNEKQDVKLVTDSKNTLINEKFVRVFLPKDKYSLLSYDVSLVETPNFSIGLDDLIAEHCIDAHAFVLVINNCLTLPTRDVKTFLHNVMDNNLFKPDIFILINKWESCCEESQHKPYDYIKLHKVATNFLVNELKAYTPNEAVSRIFFISAKEVLEKRISQAQNSEKLDEGLINRYKEFENFESRLEDRISKFPIKTEFLNRSEQGINIIEGINNIMDTFDSRCQELKNSKESKEKKLKKKLNPREQELKNITDNIHLKIDQIYDNMEKKIHIALIDEIHNLSNLVDEFELPFPRDPLLLNNYERRLNEHVVLGLHRNVLIKLSSELNLTIDQTHEDMIKQMSELLPDDKKKIDRTNPLRGQYEVFYSFHFNSPCHNFQEQLEFKFSWVLSTLVTRISSLANWILNQAQVPISPSWIIQEREFKRKYVIDFATRDWNFKIISENSSNQVRMRLLSNFANLCQLVNEYTTEIKKDIFILGEELKILSALNSPENENYNIRTNISDLKKRLDDLNLALNNR